MAHCAGAGSTAHRLRTLPLLESRRLAHAQTRPRSGTTCRNFLPQKPPRLRVSLNTLFGVSRPQTVLDPAWAAPALIR